MCGGVAMGVSGEKARRAKSVLTERQQKWFASVEASLERDTGKSIAEWVKIAKKCPETAPRKRTQWFRENYGLGVNRIAHIVSVAFPDGPSWDEPDALLDQLWKEKEGRAIYDAVAKLVRKEFRDAVIGPRKTFVSFSRKIQFAGILPARGGKAELGLPLPLSASKRLTPMKRRPWAEKHTAILLLSTPKEVDAEVKRLLKLAYAKG
ncbi:MAG: DUF4287 domain-containing protein [Hyphomonadaceae bacterium]|nr:DUF4287 domain-containing protein [Hyphomonadaceae bacterium]